jgi:TonB family protein
MKVCLTIVLGLLLISLSPTPGIAEQIEENWQPYVIYKPDPFLPAVALRKGWGGTIRCLLTINPKSGLVDEVKVVRHTGYKSLDAETVMTLFKWKFRPGTITKTVVTYELGVTNRARSLHGTEHKGDILNN